MAASIFFKGREREAASSTILSGNKSAGYMGALHRHDSQTDNTRRNDESLTKARIQKARRDKSPKKREGRVWAGGFDFSGFLDSGFCQ